LGLRKKLRDANSKRIPSHLKMMPGQRPARYDLAEKVMGWREWNLKLRGVNGEGRSGLNGETVVSAREGTRGRSLKKKKEGLK